MTVELIVAVGSGVAAKSPALVAFGGDSAIELFSAWLVLRRFKAGGDGSEGATARWTAWLLAALAVFIVLSSAVSLCMPSLRPEPSWVGVLLLATAAVIMPGLGRAKRHFGRRVGQRVLTGRCRAEFGLRLFVVDCLGRPFVQRLARVGLGRFCRRARASALRRLRGARGIQRQRLRLLLSAAA
jgi:hypothetical protein